MHHRKEASASALRARLEYLQAGLESRQNAQERVPHDLLIPGGTPAFRARIRPAHQPSVTTEVSQGHM